MTDTDKEIVYLPTLTNYKDPKSIAEALLDEDFSNKTLASIANAFLHPNKKLRACFLNFFQHRCTSDDFKRIALALDDKGYMYQTQGYRVKERERELTYYDDTENCNQKDKKEYFLSEKWNNYPDKPLSPKRKKEIPHRHPFPFKPRQNEY